MADGHVEHYRLSTYPRRRDNKSSQNWDWLLACGTRRQHPRSLNRPSKKGVRYPILSISHTYCSMLYQVHRYLTVSREEPMANGRVPNTSTFECGGLRNNADFVDKHRTVQKYFTRYFAASFFSMSFLMTLSGPVSFVVTVFFCESFLLRFPQSVLSDSVGV